MSKKYRIDFQGKTEFFSDASLFLEAHFKAEVIKKLMRHLSGENLEIKVGVVEAENVEVTEKIDWNKEITKMAV